MSHMAPFTPPRKGYLVRTRHINDRELCQDVIVFPTKPGQWATTFSKKKECYTCDRGDSCVIPTLEYCRSFAQNIPDRISVLRTRIECRRKRSHVAEVSSVKHRTQQGLGLVEGNIVMRRASSHIGYSVAPRYVNDGMARENSDWNKGFMKSWDAGDNVRGCGTGYID